MCNIIISHLLYLKKKNPHQYHLSTGSDGQTKDDLASNTISFACKFKLYESLFTSILLYGCETWTLLADSDKKDPGFRGQVPEETSTHLLLGAQDHRLGAEQDQLPCGPTGTFSGNWRLALFEDHKPHLLQNCPSWHLGRRSAEKMLDGERQRCLCNHCCQMFLQPLFYVQTQNRHWRVVSNDKLSQSIECPPMIGIKGVYTYVSCTNLVITSETPLTRYSRHLIFYAYDSRSRLYDIFEWLFWLRSFCRRIGEV